MSEFKVDGLGVDTIIPDGIEPVEALRCWNFYDGKLRSLTGDTEWTPMKPLAAKCEASDVDGYSWTVVRGGMTRKQAEQETVAVNDSRLYTIGANMFSSVPQRSAPCPYPFTAELPPGFGYELEVHTHDAPDECCTCGIYAATTDKLLPANGVVYGKVKLWGKIIPGERGVRAQYAYPSEFEVGADLADHPALKAFGVPITVVDRPTPDPGILRASGGLMVPHAFLTTARPVHAALPSFTFSNPNQRQERWLRVAVAANLIACAANLTLFFVNAMVLH